MVSAFDYSWPQTLSFCGVVLLMSEKGYMQTASELRNSK